MHAFLVAAVLLFFCDVASAQARDGIYSLRSQGPTPRRGARIRPSRAQLYAIDNANERYELAASWPRRAECGEVVLALGRASIANSAYPIDDISCSTTFALSRADADRAAALFRLPRLDRAPIGTAVTATFTPSVERARAGQPVEIVLTLSNPSNAPAVRFEHGPTSIARDPRLSCVIDRDGEPVEVRTGVYTGSVTHDAIAPGASFEVRTLASEWGDVSVPGRYLVRCVFQTRMMLDGTDPHDAAQRGAVWQRRFEGEAAFEVR